ncbi:MAG TPA: YiiX/YebB-like N1pC/P60 family cysteine hydrolase, partial [Planctomycetaceae bacterium]|nr:YiiX/YebB-like N1pC/P60 family cysteine hydrolase [Planctomycetaceae bacterium]
ALYLGECDDLERLGLRQHDAVTPRWQRLRDLDDQEARRVLEALRDGVWLRSLRTPFRADAVAIMRPKLTPDDVAQAIGRGLLHEGKPYDFDFDLTRSDRLVCTEVVYRAYEGIRGLRFPVTRRAGRLTIAAEDLLQMALARTHFEPVAVYAPRLAPRLLHGSEADSVLLATLPSPLPSEAG